MSQEQIKLADKLISWVLKGVLMFLGSVFLFMWTEMKDDVKTIKADVTNVRERVSRIEGKLDK